MSSSHFLARGDFLCGTHRSDYSSVVIAPLLLQITSAAETEAVTSQKLVKGHAYSVTGAEEVGAVLRHRDKCSQPHAWSSLSCGSNRLVCIAKNSSVSAELGF